MTDLLIVVDMQRDFVSGALGSEQARAIVPAVAARIRQAKAEQTQVAFTLDTHEPDYLNTREGRFLPVPHCIRDTPGWALEPDIAKECAQGMISFAKPTFGSMQARRRDLYGPKPVSLPVTSFWTKRRAISPRVDRTEHFRAT